MLLKYKDKNPAGLHIYKQIIRKLWCDPIWGRTKAINRFYKHSTPLASKILKLNTLW